MKKSTKKIILLLFMCFSVSFAFIFWETRLRWISALALETTPDFIKSIYTYLGPFLAWSIFFIAFVRSQHHCSRGRGEAIWRDLRFSITLMLIFLPAIYVYMGVLQNSLSILANLFCLVLAMRTAGVYLGSYSSPVSSDNSILDEKQS